MRVYDLLVVIYYLAQIYHEGRRFAKAYNLTVMCVYGGGSKYEQCNAVKEGCEILVATPGRYTPLTPSHISHITHWAFCNRLAFEIFLLF